MSAPPPSYNDAVLPQAQTAPYPMAHPYPPPVGFQPMTTGSFTTPLKAEPAM